MDSEPAFLLLLLLFNPHKCFLCWVISFYFAHEKKGLDRQSQLSKVVKLVSIGASV